MGGRTSFSVSKELKPDFSAKWMLSIFSDLPLIQKTPTLLIWIILGWDHSFSMKVVNILAITFLLIILLILQEKYFPAKYHISSRFLHLPPDLNMTSVCSKHRHRCACTAQMIMLVDSVVWAKTICLLSLACLLPHFTMSAFLICSLIYEGSLNQGINSWRVCKVKNIIFQDEPNIGTNI